MKACIYARTQRSEKSHKRITLENQIERCRVLARTHNLTVDAKNVFTDIDADGAVPPSCWAHEDEESRPALGALIEAIEEGRVKRVIVARTECISSSSQVLLAFMELCRHHAATVVAAPEQTINSDDPAERFAASLLRPCLQLDTETEREAKAALRTRKIEEIERLKDKIVRLEAEVAELG